MICRILSGLRLLTALGGTVVPVPAPVEAEAGFSSAATGGASSFAGFELLPVEAPVPAETEPEGVVAP